MGSLSSELRLFHSNLLAMHPRPSKSCLFSLPPSLSQTHSHSLSLSLSLSLPLSFSFILNVHFFNMRSFSALYKMPGVAARYTNDSLNLHFVLYSQLLKDRHLMVRVGGGWDTLQHYLAMHDPCKVKEFEQGVGTYLHAVGKYKVKGS